MSKTIAISGTIGVGKTTLVNSLGELDGFKSHKERVDRELLELFTKVNIEKSLEHDRPVELINQFSFLNETIIRDAKIMFDTETTHILDRPLSDHIEVFAKMNLSNRQYALYKGLQELILNQLGWEKYDMIILLTNNDEENKKKVHKRGRNAEELTPEYTEYLSMLNTIYNSDEYIDELREYSDNVIVIDVNGKTQDEVFEEALGYINSLEVK